jgi:Ulp1 family protease
MLIPVNIVQHHWFLLQVNFISNTIIVYDSIIRDPSVYVDYFRRLEMWLNYAVVPVVMNEE